MTSLELLNEIKKRKLDGVVGVHDLHKEDIEQAINDLKKLEKIEFNSLAIETDYLEVCKDYKKLEREHEFLREHYNELLNESNKESKALEIIKEKKVDVRFLFQCKRLKDYNYIYKGTSESKLCLTQEEYKLLKEVLI